VAARYLDEAAIRCGIRGATRVIIEQSDERAVQCTRYITFETIPKMADDPIISLPAVAS
jgi:hypothetical protein